MEYKNTNDLSLREYERLIWIVEMHSLSVGWKKANQDLEEKLRRLMNEFLNNRYKKTRN